MATRMVLRALALLTVLLGVGMYVNVLSVAVFRDWHMLFGILTAVGALIVFRQPNGRHVLGVSVRRLAQIAPLLPLVIGIAMLLNASFRTIGLITLHGVLGLVAVGFIEMALSRRGASAAKDTRQDEPGS